MGNHATQVRLKGNFIDSNRHPERVQKYLHSTPVSSLSQLEQTSRRCLKRKPRFHLHDFKRPSRYGGKAHLFALDFDQESLPSSGSSNLNPAKIFCQQNADRWLRWQRRRALPSFLLGAALRRN
jgi:hypothetical protein